MRSLLATALLPLALAPGCAYFRYPENPALAQRDEERGYRMANLELGPGNSDRTFVVVTLSGGGTRAAALAYGVLQALDDVELRGGATLLDEVDVISSVSGGSFAAAYYGLYGKERFLERFPEDVLYRKIERAYLLRLLAPWNWLRLLSPWFARSDLADAYYGRHIYHGSTYADLPRRRPFIVINASDLSLGAQFSFTQEHFDRLCSDLDGVAISRAVTASSAFPVVFTPLTLRNRPKDSCGYETPLWVELALHDLHVSPARYERATGWKAYEDSEARPFVHLSDGGLADNIGLRGPADALTTTDSDWSVLRRIQTLDRLVVIVADAKPAGSHEADASSRPPGFVSVLESAATNPMENYSSDTVEIMRQTFEEWRAEESRFAARRARCDAFAPGRAAECYQTFRVTDDDRPRFPAVYLVHVRFDAIEDPERRAAVENIRTGLQLPRAQVELLVEAAREILSASPAYEELLADLRGEAGPD